MEEELVMSNFRIRIEFEMTDDEKLEGQEGDQYLLNTVATLLSALPVKKAAVGVEEIEEPKNG